MNVLRHDLLYWQIAHDLIIVRQMRIIDWSPNQDELWIERGHRHKRSFIRLKRYDIDWANWLKQDIQKVEQTSELLRKRLGQRNLHIDNVYLSGYLPVDSFELAEGKENGRITVSTMLVTQDESYKGTLEKLYESWNIPLPRFEEWEREDTSKIYPLQEEIKVTTEKRDAHDKALFSYGKPILTYLLLISIALMFAALERSGGSTNLVTLIDFGAKYNPLILEGEYWRFISSMFLHIGFLHYFMNSLALFFLGSFVERIYGTKRFFIIYFVAGLFGSVVSFAFHDQVSAGASGAIFGCFGALLYFGLIHRDLFFRTIGRSILFILGLNLAFGFIVPVIDNAAHIGGLIGGFLASSFLHLPKHKRMRKNVMAFFGTFFVLFALVMFGLLNDNKQASVLVQLQLAQELMQQEEIEKAYPIVKEMIEKDPSIPEAYFLLAYAQVHLQLFTEAEQSLLLAIDLKPNFHEAHYNLALVYVELEKLQLAVDSVDRALQLQDEPMYRELYEKLVKLTGERSQ